MVAADSNRGQCGHNHVVQGRRVNQGFHECIQHRGVWLDRFFGVVVVVVVGGERILPVSKKERIRVREFPVLLTQEGAMWDSDPFRCFASRHKKNATFWLLREQCRTTIKTNGSEAVRVFIALKLSHSLYIMTRILPDIPF